MIKKLPKISDTKLHKLFTTYLYGDEGRICPYCKEGGHYVIEGGKRFKCKGCKKKYRDWTGTHLGEYRLSEQEVYHMVWCFVIGHSALNCSKTTDISYQTVFNFYNTLRKCIPNDMYKPLVMDPENGKYASQECRKFCGSYLNRYRGIADKNKKLYIKEITWRCVNQNENIEDNVLKIISFLLGVKK